MKLESLAIVQRCLYDPMFSRFATTPTCDDGQTDRHAMTANITLA